MTNLFFFIIIVVGGITHLKANICLGERSFVRTFVRKRTREHLFVFIGAGAANGRSREKLSKKKKKNRSPPYIISHFRSICQYFFEKYFCKICVKFGLSSLVITKFLWYNIYGGRGGFTRTFVRSPYNPPTLHYTIRSCDLSRVFGKILSENF